MGRTHSFKKGLVSGTCAVCNEKFRGLIKRGMVCAACKMQVHEECLARVPDSCTAAAAASPAASSSAKKPKAKAGGGAADILAQMGLGDDDLGFDDDEDAAAGEEDGDMDDGDLAAQLTVQRPSKAKAKAKKPSSSAAEVDVDGVLAATGDDAAADAVEATDEDMNDPSLLGELGDLGVPIDDDEEEEEEEETPKAKAKKEEDPREELKRQIEEETRLFAQLKASGDKQGAIEHGRNVMALKKKLQELDGKAAPAPAPAAAAAEPAPAVTAKPVQPAQRRPPSPAVGATPPAVKQPSPTQTRRASPTQARRTSPTLAKPAEEDPAVIAEKNRVAQYEALEAAIAEEVKRLQGGAIKAKHDGDMTQAKALLMQSKEVAAQLETLRKMKADPARPPVPEVQRETVERKVERSFSQVMPNELEITVSRAEGLVSSDYPQLSTYVFCEHQWSETAPVTKLQSAIVANSANPVYDFVAKVPIERTRSTARAFEKRKIVFTLWHRRGFIHKDVQIGKFEIVLAELLRKAESVQRCPVLKPESKRPIADGAAVEVTLRLRDPLLCKEELVIKEEKITLKFSSAPTTTPAAPAAAAKPKPPAAPEPSPAAAKPKPAAAAPAPAAAAGDGEEMSEQEKLLEEANNVDRLVSNDVLEWEKARVTKQVAALKAARKEVPDELTDRLEMIDIKMQMLIVSVQTGKLTQEAYLEMVQKAATKEKQLALRLKAAGLREDALLAMQRFKVLEAEIASASEGGDE